jgi:hypothetical protein
MKKPKIIALPTGDDLDKMIAALERNIVQQQRDLETAKRFRDALPRLRGGEATPVGQTPVINGDKEYGKTTAAIRRAIDACPNRYDIYDVEKALKANGQNISRITISQTLSRLVRTKKLKIRRKGKGRKPTKFTKEGTLDQVIE